MIDDFAAKTKQGRLRSLRQLEKVMFAGGRLPDFFRQ
jgi:hypothetical protein